MDTVGSKLRMGSWGSKGPPSSHRVKSQAATQGSSDPQEAAALENALAAADMLVNDDIKGAVELLRTSSSSPYTDLGLSIITFMQAVMGFEPELMHEAVERTRVCEKTSLRDWKAAQSSCAGSSDLATWTPTPGRFYPPGCGLAVVNAAAQLMHGVTGVTGVLDDSDRLEKLGSAIKAFFKLRKAYSTLSEIINFENRILHKPDPEAEMRRRAEVASELRAARMPGGFGDDEVDNLFAALDNPSESAEFITLAGVPSAGGMTDEFGRLGRFSIDTPRAHERSSSANGHSRSSSATMSTAGNSQPLTPTLAEASPFDYMIDPIDIFVHSASNMAFGALQLVLGMVPPAYRPLLSVVGFKGSRERGLAMLWKASTHPNFCGALSGLILLAYYTGLASLSDVLPAMRDFDQHAGIIGYPEDRVRQLLADCRSRYPESLLWRLIQGRVLGDQRRMTDSLRILRHGPDSNLRQITALTYWQIALDASFVRDWDLTRDAFLHCVELNDWTHAYYYYCAAAAELELYRDAFAANKPVEEQRRHKQAAEAFFRKAPPLAGHKRLLTKRIPHEVFVERRVQRWEQRAKELGVDLADAIGASPAQEMTYIWNGTKKMTDNEAKASMEDLRWERCTAPAATIARIAALPEEASIRALAVAALLRHLRRFEDARRILVEKALSNSRHLHVFKKEYVLPMATYEMAAIAWDEVCAVPGGEREALDFKKAKTEECQVWLDRVCKWGDRYLMDGRLGMRFSTALDTLAWYRTKMGWDA